MLPDKWIDRIFGHMSGMYGSKFADLWRGADLQSVKALWADKLGGFVDKPEAIKQALYALDDKPFPPTLPEFLGLCREASKRIGNANPPALEHKLSPEELERNRQRAAELIGTLGRKMTSEPGSTDGAER